MTCSWSCRLCTVAIALLTCAFISLFGQGPADVIWSSGGHAGLSRHVATSADGRFAATIGDDHSIKIWRMPDGKLFRAISFNEESSSSITFSPNGQFLAVAGNTVVCDPTCVTKGTVQVWRVADGALVYRQTFFGQVSSTAFSPNGLYLAAAGGNYAYLWVVYGWQLFRVLDQHTTPVKALAFRRDGQELVTASEDGAYRRWRVPAGTIVGSLQGPPAASTAYLADGGSLLVHGSDRTVHVVDIADGSVVRTLDTDVYTCALSNDGAFTSVASDGSSDFRVVRISDGAVVQAMSGEGMIEGLAFSPSGDSVLNCGGRVADWAVSSGQLRKVFSEHSAPISALAYSPDSQLLASAQARNDVLPPATSSSVRLWNAVTGDAQNRLFGNTSTVDALAFNLDGTRLVSTAQPGPGQDALIAAWLTSNGSQVQSDAVAAAGIRSTLSLDGVISGWSVPQSSDTQINIWLNSTAEFHRALGAHPTDVSCLAFSPNRAWLATGDTSGVLKIWDVFNGWQYGQIVDQTEVFCVAFSPNNQLVAAGVRDSGGFKLRLWRVSDRALLWSAPYEARSISFAWDGATLATGSDQLRLWRVSDGELLAINEPVPATYGITTLAYSRDNRSLAIGRSDAVVQVARNPYTTRSVSGRIVPSEYVGTAALSARFEIRAVGQSAPFATWPLVFASDGSFSVSCPDGEFVLALKFNSYLRRTIHVDANTGNIPGLVLDLLPGDLDGNNIVDDTDVFYIIAGYARENDPSDVNGDGIVDDADLTIVLLNYGMQGDP